MNTTNFLKLCAITILFLTIANTNNAQNSMTIKLINESNNKEIVLNKLYSIAVWVDGEKYRGKYEVLNDRP